MIWNKTKYYDSIHNCPIFYWNLATKENDPKHLLISGKHKPAKAEAAFRQIFDEHIKEFGIPSGYKMYLQALASAEKEYYKATIQDLAYLPVAKIKEEQAKALLSTGPSEPFPNTLGKLSKQMGFAINPKVTTVAEFYGYVNSVNG